LLIGINVHSKAIDIIPKLNSNVNKSPGHEIHPKIIVETAHKISYPLQQLFKCSFDTNQLPADWRCANITPYIKKVPGLTLEITG